MEQTGYIELLENNYNKLVNLLGWSVDKRIILTISSHYSAEGKTFSTQSFSTVIQEIKKQTSWFSTLRSNITLKYSVAMMLDEKEDAYHAVKQLIENEEILKSAKFKRSVYSYIAALFLTENMEKKQSHAENARELFEAIRKHHPFLTSHEDMPYAVLLSSDGEDTETRADTMNRYYMELKKHGFSIGNELQWLSQILTFHSSCYIDQQVPYVVQLRDELKQAGIKIKSIYYPLIGFLAVAGAKSEQIEQFVTLYNQLKSAKLFKWYKDMVFGVTVQKILHDLVNIKESIDMSLVTTLEMLIQAEQAMMMSMTMAAVVASSSTSD